MAQGTPKQILVFSQKLTGRPVDLFLFGSPVSHTALSSAALLRGRPDGVVGNTSALESQGRGFKSRSGQFLGFSLCDGLFVSLTGLSSFVLIILIILY